MSKLTRLLVFAIAIVLASCFTKTINPVNLDPTHLTQSPHHTIETKRIVNQLVRSHYLPFQLDKSLSSKIFDEYVDKLDPKRMLFLSTDLERFSDKRDQLADELRAGNLDTAYQLFALMQQRFHEQYVYSLQVLAKPMILDGTETIQLDRSQSNRPTTQVEQQQLWSNFIKNDVINLCLNGKTVEESQTILIKRYTSLQRQLELSTSEDVFNKFINAFTSTLDPHTNYLSPIETNTFMSSINLSLEGIGAELKQNEDYIEIVSLVANGPAAKSKQLHIGDKIIGVGQYNKPIVEVIGWRLEDVIALIKGPKGSYVTLEILSENGQTSRMITLKRMEIKLEEGKVKKTIKHINGQAVAIVTIPSFYIGVAKDTKALLETLHNDRVVALVVDLRMNGGGMLFEAVALSNLFLPNTDDNPIVQMKASDNRVTILSQRRIENILSLGSLAAKDDNAYFSLPMVVVVDGLSASASEIFAAAMQAYNRAILFGETTFGKGTVQKSLPLATIYDDTLGRDVTQFGSLRYTEQKFYGVDGYSIQLKGVTPDLTMQSVTSALNKIGEQYNKNPLPSDSIRALSYHPVKSNLSSKISILQKKHEDRLALNRSYQSVLNYVDQYSALKSQQVHLPLDLATRKIFARKDEQIQLDYVNHQLSLLHLPPITTLSQLEKETQWPDINLDEAILVALDLSVLGDEVN